MQGYKNVAPSREAEEIDSSVVANCKCRRCGAPCYYDPWTNGGSYRAFAVCTVCGHEEEF
jgi:hypothetical protein